jgi:hypothetical protein
LSIFQYYATIKQDADLTIPAFFPFVAKASQLHTQKSNWRNTGELHGFCAISDCDKRRNKTGNNFFIQLVYFKTGLALNMLFYLSWIISLCHSQWLTDVTPEYLTDATDFH